MSKIFKEEQPNPDIRQFNIYNTQHTIEPIRQGKKQENVSNNQENDQSLDTDVTTMVE